MGMKRIAPVVLLLLAGLAGLWWLLQDDSRSPMPRNEVALDDAPAAPAPRPEPEVHAPTEEPRPQPPAPTPDHPAPLQPAPTTAEPALHQPDYGPRLRRGGAQIEFELADAQGAAIPAQYCSVSLWRQLGSHWLKEEVGTQSGTSLVVCDGLGEENAPGAGLEPGDYELDIHSNRYGALRHRFTVVHGEKRRDKLLLPNWTRTICFRFIHPDGSPVHWVKSPPVVTSTSPALIGVDRSNAPDVPLRNPPTEPNLGLTGGGWASSRSSSARESRDTNSVYPTDDGRYWVRVFAGAENTVRFNLGTLWGRDEYTVTDTFTEARWDDFTVSLATVADFADQVANLEKRKADPPGGKLILAADTYNEFTRPPQPYDPLTAPVRPHEQRLVVRVSANFEPNVEISYDGKASRGVFQRTGDLFSAYFSNEKPAWFRISDGAMFATAWERVPELAPGAVTELSRTATASIVVIGAEGLSPTLRAFAHTLDFDLGLAKAPAPKPVEDPKITEGATDDIVEEPSDRPSQDLAPNPNDADRRNETPTGGRLLRKVILHQRDGELRGELRLGPGSLDGLTGDETLVSRVHLRGVARMTRRPRSGGLNKSPDGRDQFTPITLNGTWRKHEGEAAALIRGGNIQPHLDNAFCLRAIGDQGEGLPWVAGVVFEHEHDQTAQQVRQVLARHDLRIDTQDHKAYTADLAQAQAAPTEANLRALIGKAYDHFETDAQRLWFAAQGAWYSGRQRAFSDEHGYIATQGMKLEPGKVYVLYLWSQSRDDNRPDARVVFKAGQGVTDLGAIALPSYR